MKKIFLVAILLWPLFCAAQNNLGKADDYERIPLNVVIPEQVENIPDHAQSLLRNKLLQAVTESGMGGAGVNPRFLLTAKMELLTKDVTPTIPPMEAYTFEVYLYIVDYVDQNILSSTSFTTKGAGQNKNKAYTNGLRTVDLKNQNVRKFLDEGKRKIIEYYNSRCDFVIANAKSLAAQNQFGAAINVLSTVPQVCKDCYMQCLDAIAPIYQDFIDHDCQMMITVASAVWSAEPNSNGAMKAGAVLSQIDPDSRCYQDAQSKIAEIGKKVRQDEQRDWNFMEKVYEDQVMLQTLRIQAFRDVGVAYGQNQQPTYNNILWVFR